MKKSFLFLLTLSLAYTMQANEQEESYVPYLCEHISTEPIKNSVIISKQLVDNKTSYVLTIASNSNERSNYYKRTLEDNSFYYETLDKALYEAGWLDRMVDFSYIDSSNNNNLKFIASLQNFSDSEKRKIIKFINNNRYSCTESFELDYLRTDYYQEFNDSHWPPKRAFGIVWANHGVFLPYDDKLIVAIRSNNEEEALELIENGEDIDRCDGIGRTPLHYAAKHNMCKLISVLVDKGCDITAEAMGWTPLHEAIAAESHDAVQLLMNISSTIGSKKYRAQTFYKCSPYFSTICDILYDIESSFLETKTYMLYHPEEKILYRDTEENAEEANDE